MHTHTTECHVHTHHTILYYAYHTQYHKYTIAMYYEYIWTHMPRQSHYNMLRTPYRVTGYYINNSKTYFGTGTAAAAVAALVDLVMVVMFLDRESSLGFRHTLLLPI